MLPAAKKIPLIVVAVSLVLALFASADPTGFLVQNNNKSVRSKRRASKLKGASSKSKTGGDYGGNEKRKNEGNNADKRRRENNSNNARVQRAVANANGNLRNSSTRERKRNTTTDGHETKFAFGHPVIFLVFFLFFWVALD